MDYKKTAKKLHCKLKRRTEQRDKLIEENKDLKDQLITSLLSHAETESKLGIANRTVHDQIDKIQLYDETVKELLDKLNKLEEKQANQEVIIEYLEARG
jgi:Holliday junction resolvasome RuvABC DNA-binding subunit